MSLLWCGFAVFWEFSVIRFGAPWLFLLASIAGAVTCATALVLFVDALDGAPVATILFAVFGGATVLTSGALTSLVHEMSLAARGVRPQMREQTSDKRVWGSCMP